VIAYLIREKGFDFEEALTFVRTQRLKVFPNNGFIKQLKEYAKMVTLRKSA
jgi:hypothetical protein